MSVDAQKNFAYSTVATAPSPATSGLSLVVGSGEGANFPATPFNAVVCPVGTRPTGANAEIVRVTGRSTDTFTIARQQEGTSARTIVVGDQIFTSVTAKTITDLQQQRWQETLDAWRMSSPAVFAENFSRLLVQSSDAIPSASGTLEVFAGPKLYAGEVVSGFSTAVSGTSATLTHSWWCLIDPATLSVVCKTNDDTSVWTTGTVRTVAMGTPFTILASQAYYVGLCIVAGTVPTLRGMNTQNTARDISPRLAAKSTTTLTNPASLGATAAALTQATSNNFMPWIGIS